MNLTRKLAGGLFLATVLFIGIGFLIYAVTFGSVQDLVVGGPPSMMEKVAISEVKVDAEEPNILLVDVKWLSTGPAKRNITFTNAVIKEPYTDKHVLEIDLDNIKLLPDSETTVNVVMENKLPSGKYVVMLVTSAGGCFVAPQFIQL